MQLPGHSPDTRYWIEHGPLFAVVCYSNATTPRAVYEPSLHRGLGALMLTQHWAMEKRLGQLEERPWAQ